MAKFKIGDKVRIVNRLLACSTYKQFVKQYGGGYAKYYKNGYNPKNGDIGTVVGVGEHPSYGTSYVVCSNGRAFCMSKETGIELIKPAKQSIHIYTDGVTTTAKLCEGKTVVKTAKAICCTEDEFVFETGASLALDRLLDRPTYGALTDENKRLQAEVGKWKYEAKCEHDHAVELMTEVDRLKAELAKTEQPKYYSGKVVCVDVKWDNHIYTVGKVYEIKDGVFVADKGSRPFGLYKVTSFDDFERNTESKFIELVEG